MFALLLVRFEWAFTVVLSSFWCNCCGSKTFIRNVILSLIIINKPFLTLLGFNAVYRIITFQAYNQRSIAASMFPLSTNKLIIERSSHPVLEHFAITCCCIVLENLFCGKISIIANNTFYYQLNEGIFSGLLLNISLSHYQNIMLTKLH